MPQSNQKHHQRNRLWQLLKAAAALPALSVDGPEPDLEAAVTVCLLLRRGRSACPAPDPCPRLLFFGIPLQEAIEALAGEVKRGKAPGVRDAQARSGRLVIFHTRDSR